MEHKIIFNKKNNSKYIKLNAENPFLRITRIEFPSIPKKSPNLNLLIPRYNIKTITTDVYEGTSSDQIHGIPHTATNQNYIDVTFPLDKTVAWKSEHTYVEFLFTNQSESDEDVVIHYTHFDKKVDLKNPFEDFYNHIRQNDNVKILFSAPFGQGKTTFLNHFV